MISFKKEIYNTTYLHPRKNFEKTHIFAEMRYDPLTGHRVRVFNVDWWKTNRVDFFSMGSNSKGRCPFCEGAIEKFAARFLEDFCQEGHFKRNECTLIPNILPYAENAAVAVLTKEHIVPMGTMKASIIEDGIKLVLDYAKDISAFDKKDYDYALLHWNYMPPSGGSLIHPHMQVYVTDTALNYHKRVLERACEFRKKYNAEFFIEYLKKELEEQERFIIKKGRCYLISPFAGRGMLGEFLIIINDSYNYRDITDDDIKDISHLIYGLTLFLDKKSIPAFNLALFSSPVKERIMLNHIRIYPRVYRDTEVFATDIETPTLLYGESFSLISPEKNASELREFLETLNDYR